MNNIHVFLPVIVHNTMGSSITLAVTLLSLLLDLIMFIIYILCLLGKRV